MAIGDSVEISSVLFSHGPVPSTDVRSITVEDVWTLGRSENCNVRVRDERSLPGHALRIRLRKSRAGVLVVQYFARVPEMGQTRVITSTRTENLHTGNHGWRVVAPSTSVEFEVLCPRLVARVSLDAPPDDRIAVSPLLPTNTQGYRTTRPEALAPRDHWQALLMLILMLDQFPDVIPVPWRATRSARSRTLGLCTEVYLKKSRQWPAKSGLRMVTTAMGIDVPPGADKIMLIAREFRGLVSTEKLDRLRLSIQDEVWDLAAIDNG